ncbi:MAG TPA: methyl-accepting chemotaxis protein [Candidatus Sericytochromatia bacterium]
MTNQLNPTFPVVKANSFSNGAATKPNAKFLVLAIGLSIILAVGIGVISYQLAYQAVIQEIAQMHLGGTSISPVLQTQLLLIFVLTSGVTALLVGAIALLAHRRVSSTPTSEKVLLFGNLASLSQPVDLNYLYQRTVEGARQILCTHRVLIYTFDTNGNGTIVAESVDPRFAQSLGNQIVDACIRDSNGGLYQHGRACVINDIYQAGLSDSRIKVLQQYQVKANMVVPILKDDQLLGFIIAHQCDQPRVWQPNDIDFFVQLASLITLRLSSLNFLVFQQQQTESFRHQLISLINDVEEAAQGDLTVRAHVTETEMGTVADFFNFVIESLRGLVTQIKQSTTLVNTSLGENEGAIRELASVSFKQAQETTRTLALIEQMTHSIQEVAGNAHYAAEVARTASVTAEAGAAAMECTVTKIMSLRETVTETAHKVKRLGESAQQISKVVSLVNQIALQTNLLAVNAGIEAARAGEEHYSFGVVAQEVGELAARCATATQEIEHILENILIETSQVVEAMEHGTHQVVEGTHLVEDAKQNLTQILEVSRQIEGVVASIGAASVAQVETSQVVNNLIKEMAEVSERTAKSSEQISSSLQQTVVKAQQLQASVEVFKVDD